MTHRRSLDFRPIVAWEIERTDDVRDKYSGRDPEEPQITFRTFPAAELAVELQKEQEPHDGHGREAERAGDGVEIQRAVRRGREFWRSPQASFDDGGEFSKPGSEGARGGVSGSRSRRARHFGRVNA